MTAEEYKSYKALWSAVLLQTLADLRPRVAPEGVPKIKDTGNPKKNKTRINKAYRNREEVRADYVADRAYAIRWMASKSRKPASFLWICDQLGLDPKVLREFAKDPEMIKLLMAGKLKLGG